MHKFLHLFFVLVSLNSLAQTPSPMPAKVILQQQSAWLGYFNQTRISNKIGLWVDLHHRRTDFATRPFQELARLGLTYYLADNVRLTAGYAIVGTHLYPSGTIRPEHRPWQQIWWTGRVSRLNITQYIRTEQRFNRRISGDQLIDGYGFNWRFRYSLLCQIPLWGAANVRPGVPNFVVQDEVFINAGKQITVNTFDQNRFFVGVSYPFNKHLTGQLGYMNLFQQQPSGSTYTSNQTMRFFLFHTLDLRE